MRNEIAAGHGQRMFYTDETGETVLASDDEEEDHVSLSFIGIMFQACSSNLGV